MERCCAACGKVNPGEARFCMGCGQPLADAEAPREVRRVVTVLFADMVGFTTLGERLDQESLRRVMDRFYAEMRGAIEAQDGTLAKFIGDAVLAVWGTPEVREDDAVRAVRAAEAMRRSLGALNEDLAQRWGVRVGMRTGVNTGEVVVDPGRPADLLVGDTLNVAARLEQAAADGEVLVGPATYRLVRDVATLEAVTPLALKGKARPMPAWRLVDGLAPDRRSAARTTAPLVGRDEELTRLRAAFAAAVETGRFGLVTLVGSPGVGKTRVAAELARAVADRADTLEGRCEATDEGMTFLPVADVLRAAAGVGEQDDPAAARERLAGALPADEPDRDRIVASAASVLGLAPAAAPEETFWGVRRYLEARARERPLVVVLEDVHWGQPTFLDLVEHLAAWGRGRVLLVALARPELRDVRPALAEGAIDLAPLGAADSRTLVEQLLGKARLPAELERRVLETTGGNPLFLAEVLRMLVDDGTLRREGDAWVATGDAAALHVPPTIHALLAARIERLAPPEQVVVERAAVIGHQFYRGAVASLAPEPVRAAIDDHLATLRRKELVSPEDALWLDEQVFRFHHVLIRDAAYRRLLKEARADLHERFADWLDEKAAALAGEHEPVVAFHLEQAHAYRCELGALDAHGREVAARAASRLRSAGRRALEREDLPAAVNLLRRALAPLEDGDPERGKILVELAEALVSAGDTAAAAGVVEELGLGADEQGDERLGARATALAGQLDNLTGAGNVRETARVVADAAAVLARLGDHGGEAKAHQVVAQAEALLGRVAATEAALDRALVAARQAGDRRRVTAVLSGAPRAALWGPTPIVRASGRCLDVVRILRMTPGNRHVEAAALRCQAVLEAMRGRADAARTILDGCRTTFEELGLTLELHETAVYAGTVELLAGDAAAAEHVLEPAAEALHALGVEVAAAHASALLARALVEQGRDDEALDATRFAEAHAGEDLKTTIAWLGVRAEVFARRGEHDEARALARRAVALGEPTDALADKADALMALAAVEEAAGDGAAATEAARRAQALYRAKDHVVGVARTERLAGEAGAEPDAALAPAVSPPAAGAAEPDTIGTRRIRRYVELYNQRAFDAMRACFAPDFRLVDHRSVAWGEMDRDAMLATVRSLIDASEDFAVGARIVAAEGGLVHALLSFDGTTTEGSAFSATLRIVQDGDDAATLSHVFAPEDEATAEEWFERMRPRAVDPEVRAAVEEQARAFNERDWDAYRAGIADDLVVRDRRTVAATESRGADASLATAQGLVEVAPDVRVELDLLAGEPLPGGGWIVAARETYRATVADADAPAAMSVCGIGVRRDGRAVLMEVLADDAPAAIARYDELKADLVRAAVGARPVDPGLREQAARQARAFNERDWTAWQAFLHEDVAAIDRRKLGAGDRHGRDAVLAGARGLIELVPDLTTEVELLAGEVLPGGAAIVAARETYTGTAAGSDAGAAPASITVYGVGVLRGGRSVRREAIEGGEAEALARYDALRAELADGAAERSPLAAARLRGWCDAVASGDPVRIRAWHAPDAQPPEPPRGPVEPCAVIEERAEWLLAAGSGDVDRVLTFDAVGRVVRAESFAPGGRAAVLARLDELERGGPPPPLAARVFGVAPVAARGERFCIARDGAAFRVLAVDADGRPAADERIEEERDAHRRLDELAAAHPVEVGPLAAGRGAVAASWAFSSAFNARDGAALSASFAPAFRFEDFRPGVRHGYGRDGAVAWCDELWSSVRDVQQDVVVLAADDHASYARTFWTGRRHSYRIEVDTVTQVDEEGRSLTMWAFEPGSPEGWARWEELAAAELAPYAAARVEAWLAAGEDALADFYAPDADRLPERPTARWPIAQRGDFLTAFADRIVVWERTGRILREEPFDDRAALLARLDALEREGPPPSLVERTAARWRAAFDARDFGAVETLYTPDAQFRDRRPLTRGEGTGPAHFRARTEAAAAMGPNTTRSDRTLTLVGDRFCLSAHEWKGHDDLGGSREGSMLAVSAVDRDGRLAVVEFFAPEDEALAHARLDELASEAPVTPSPLAERGPALRGYEEWFIALGRRDRDGMAALIADDLVYEDRRSGMAHTYGKAEDRRAWDDSLREVPDTHGTGLVLAATARCSLARCSWTGMQHGLEIVMDIVSVHDEAGRFWRQESHEPGDPVAWERFRALTGSEAVPASL